MLLRCGRVVLKHGFVLVLISWGKPPISKEYIVHNSILMHVWSKRNLSDDDSDDSKCSAGEQEQTCVVTGIINISTFCINALGNH